ncbi:hypothetical protein M404DRAFT_721802 [Pisolithus tinctorius Marx 270]|uniref:Uncharacterized protein n=1 Tax=Pisolithus tinctorius Marx 270 TaxID=870435 RepID=A0A0C3P3N0_PISTI|nr:hypothetical protein M404DRAFT_721802 [Pisolithus tinctorius Marx 270]
MSRLHLHLTQELSEQRSFVTTNRHRCVNRKNFECAPVDTLPVLKSKNIVSAFHAFRGRGL